MYMYKKKKSPFICAPGCLFLELFWMSSSGTELWLTLEDMQNVMYAGPNEEEGQWCEFGLGLTWL